MLLPIIPSPKKYELSDHILKFPCRIFTAEETFLTGCQVFADAFRTIQAATLSREPGGIELSLDLSLTPGSYAVDVGDTIRAFAPDTEGALYALATLLQLIHYENGTLRIPQVHIQDYADKAYRSLMVDLSRQWHPFPKLLKFVDICFFFKIKYLHLHFIDGLRYTLPSRVLPNLPTEGEHYSFEQIAQLNAYAKDRGIVLVPEYECPGHAQQCIDKYPEIFADHADGKPLGNVYNEDGDILQYRNLICATSQSSMDATLAMLKEMAEMFPDSPYIHIGGDEANIQLWNECDDCTRYMRQNGIADVQELYSEYVGKIASYILSLGRTPIVWEGFPKKGHERIPKETIVVAWESYYHMAYDLLEEGFRVINASWEPLYIVPSFTCRWNAFDILKWDVHRWQHWWPKSEAHLHPFTVPATDRVLGAILCSWEQTFEQEINAVMENLAALSERTWNVQRKVTDEEYNEMYQSQRMRLGKLIQDR